MDVLMPQLGETVTEGKISTWFKNVGDAVKPGDNLFEIETDKVSMEVPAIEAGVITEIRVAKGEVATVGAVVAVIGGSAGATARITSSTSPLTSAPAARVAPLYGTCVILILCRLCRSSFARWFVVPAPPEP